jgi:hypothetical protein
MLQNYLAAWRRGSWKSTFPQQAEEAAEKVDL